MRIGGLRSQRLLAVFNGTSCDSRLINTQLQLGGGTTRILNRFSGFPLLRVRYESVALPHASVTLVVILQSA
jgi:hypothetical protein